MSKSSKPADEIATVLDRTDALIQNLKREPWAEYDLNLQKALLMLMKQGFLTLQRVAKAISRVTPEETRSESPTNGEPWWGSVLDEMK